MKITTRDNILYLTVALGIVGVGALIVSYQESHGLPIRLPISDKMFAFGWTTALVFGYAIQKSRKLWPSPRFWVTICVLLIAFLPFQWALVGFGRIGIGLISAASFGELVCLLLLLEKLVPPLERHRHKAPHQEP